MPTLNRIRAANVHFDHDAKCYDDETFTLWGRTTLLHLDNGGGKTLLLRLMSHTILGFEPQMGRRFLRGMLLNNTSRCSWCLVEWRLDDPEHYLLVGLCFALREGDPHWFHFVVEYREEHPFDLGHLQFKSDSQWLRFEEFQRLLQQAGREYGIKTFPMDRRGDLGRYLATYRIFRHDWEEILKSNADEGGLTNLFKDFRTSKQLLQGLIIPRISGALTAAGADDLVEALHTHVQTLRKIPELQGRRKAYETLAVEAERLLTVLRSYQETTAALDHIQREILGASQLSAAELRRLRAELEIVDLQLQTLAGRRDGVEWEQASVELLRARLDLAAKKEVAAVEAERCDHQSSVAAELKRRRTIALATNDQLDRQEKEAEAERLNAQMQAAKLSEPQLLSKIAAAERILKALLLAERYRIAHAMTAAEAKAEALRIEEEKLQKEQAALHIQLEATANTLGRLQEERSAILKRQERHAKTLEPAEILDPASALTAITADLAAATAAEAETADRIAAFDTAIATNNSELVSGAVRAEKLQADAKTVGSELERYRKRSAQVTAALDAAGVRDAANHLYDPAIPAALNVRRKDLIDQRPELTIGIDLEQRWLAWLSGDERYLNSDIQAVALELERLGLRPQSGLEWLGYQVPEPATQAAVIARRPLLPYALVLQRQDYARLTERPELLGNLLLSAPVPILRAEADLFEAEPTAIDFLLPQHKGTVAFITGSRQSLITDAQRRLAKLQTRQQDLDGQVQQLDHTLMDLTALCQEFGPDYLGQTLARVHDLAEQLRSAQAAQAERSSQQATLNAQLADARKAQREATANVTTLNGRRTALLDWHSDWMRLPAVAQGIDDAEAAKRRHNQSLDTMSDTLRGLNDAKLSLNGQLFGLRQQAQTVGVRLDALSTVDPAPGATGTLEEASAHCDGLRETLRLRHSDLAELQQRRERLVREAAALRDRIAHIHKVTPAELDERTERVGIEAFAELDRRIATAEEELRQRQKTALRLNEAAQKQSGVVHAKEGEIRRRFGKEAADLRGSADEHERRLTAAATEIAASQQRLATERATLAGTADRMDAACKGLVVLAQDAVGTPLDPGWTDPRREAAAYVAVASRRLREARERCEGARHSWEKSCRAFDLVLQECGVGGTGQLLELLRRESDNELGEEQLQSLIAFALQGIDSINTDLAIHEQLLDQLVQDCLMRARDVREAVRDVPKFSVVLLPGEEKRRRLLNVEYPEGVEDETHAMSAYLLALVERLRQMPEAEWMQAIRESVEPGQLLGVLVDLSRAVVRVAKVVAGGTAAIQDPWEQVIAPSDQGGWSEGEKYLGALTVHLCLLSYIRNRLCGADRSPKVLISDNPFARMNAQHLLTPISQLLDATATQWVCATGHRDHNIFRLFPIHYGLKLLPAISGVSWVKGELHPNTVEIIGVENPHPLHGPERPRQRQATLF